MTIKTKIITVTPQDAERYLKNMIHNRPPSVRHTTFLANAMRRGEWHLTGQPIIFDERGRLLDGQHRMRAIIASGVTVTILAVYGAQDSTFSKMDQGRSRSVSDALGSVPNRTAVAGAVCLLHAAGISTGLPGANNHRPTNDQALAILAAHPGIINACSHIAGKKRARRMLGAGCGGFCLYQMSRHSDTEATRFIDKIDSGEGLGARSQCLALRNLLIDGKVVDGVNGRYSIPELICIVSYAWRADCMGVKSPRLTLDRAKEAWLSGMRWSL